jgi:hypothetical protein
MLRFERNSGKSKMHTAEHESERVADRSLRRSAQMPPCKGRRPLQPWCAAGRIASANFSKKNFARVSITALIAAECKTLAKTRPDRAAASGDQGTPASIAAIPNSDLESPWDDLPGHD